MTDLIYAVDKDEVDEAVVPIENSIEGAVSVTLDMLATDVNLKIKGEIIIAVNQNFMVKKGTNTRRYKAYFVPSPGHRTVQEVFRF